MHDPRFSILKAFAIILVVVSFAGSPLWLQKGVSAIHFPALFICAGYFFSTARSTDGRTYFKHLVKRLYLPFVRWSLFFLVVHNLLFSLGFLSEKHAAAAGVALHPCNFHEFCQNAVSIVVNMSGYNPLLGESFWFFRAFLLSSAAFFLLFRIFSKFEQLKSPTQTGLAVFIVSLSLTAFSLFEHITLTGIPQGGYRELAGLTLISIGFLLQRYEAALRPDYRTALPCLAVTVLFAVFLPAQMSANATPLQFFSLLVPAVTGFVLLAYLAHLLTKLKGGVQIVTRGFDHIGRHALHILAFHLLAFKLVSILAVGYFDLPWADVAGHPVVKEAAGNALFILLYTAAGVLLPLLWLAGYARMRQNVLYIQNSLANAVIAGAQLLLRALQFAIKYIGHALLAFVLNFWQGIKEIIAASKPQDDGD